MPSPTWNRALVTGASYGLGERFAYHLADRGTSLVLVARSADRLAALADELTGTHGVAVEVLAADLTEPAQLATVEARLAATEDPVDLLVNNAGFGTTGSFVDIQADREDLEIRLNICALVRLTHAALPPMKARGHGGVLNVSSMAGFQPIPYMATYAATKAFVTSFTEALHEELRGSGVHVSVLCPGFTKTRFAEAAGAEEQAEVIPSPLWLEPDEVVRAGLQGIDANRAVVVPGGLYRAGSLLSRSVPSTVTRRFLRLGMRFAR